MNIFPIIEIERGKSLSHGIVIFAGQRHMMDRPTAARRLRREDLVCRIGHIRAGEMQHRHSGGIVEPGCLFDPVMPRHGRCSHAQRIAQELNCALVVRRADIDVV